MGVTAAEGRREHRGNALASAYGRMATATSIGVKSTEEENVDERRRKSCSGGGGIHLFDLYGSMSICMR